jgi:two-component system sensor histidine kinase/response regulator
MAGLCILLVDFNHTNRRILEEVLHTWGARPATVEDGPTALVALHEASDAGDPFVVALIDGIMPEMDGFELAGRIRNEPGIDEPLMVMLTSSGQAGEAERSRDAGINAYLTKPVRQSELLSVLTRLIEATSASGDGVSRAAPRVSSSPSEDEIKMGSGFRILLAEDHLINQKVAVAMLRKMGHEPTVVDDDRKALEAWESGPFDLILMDIQMPDMDGFEAVAAIRARERKIGGHVPIVALTAHAMKGDRERCLEAGFDDYLAKPIHSDLLAEAIERWKSRTPYVPRIDVGVPTTVREFDREAALVTVGGDEALLAEVVGLFLDDCPRLLATIDGAIRRSDAATLKRVAHTVRGVATTFALPAVVDAARALETKGNASDWDGAIEGSEELRRAFQRVRPALEELATVMS